MSDRSTASPVDYDLPRDLDVLVHALNHRLRQLEEETQHAAALRERRRLRGRRTGNLGK